MRDFVIQKSIYFFISPLLYLLLGSPKGIVAARTAAVFDDRHPLIVSLPSRRESANHFGYALDWIKEDSRTVSIFVGAPKDEQSGGGSLFKCSVDWEIGTKECLDLTPSQSSGSNEDWSTQLFGLSVSADRRDLWACAPSFRRNYLKTWTHKNTSAETYSSMMGHCFVYEKKRNYENPSRVIPLKDSKMFYGWKEFPGEYAYGALYGQAGMAIHRIDGRVFLGAPGAWNWTGSLAAVDSNDFSSSTLYQPWSKWSKDKRSINGPSHNDYSGYSIHSCSFFQRSSEKLVAMGSPRHGPIRAGSVFIGGYPEGKDDVDSRFQIDGDQLGEYFGASIACMDLDGDGGDEIVIGSPLYNGRSNRKKRQAFNPLSYFFQIEDVYDVGRLTVFKFHEEDRRFFRVASISGKMSRGRFGSTLLNAGDLNGDGTEDLIVGSPYENEGRGAIRLYLGNSMRIVNRDFVQTITAEGLSRDIFGFGISLSRPLDIDGNSVKDIAVGANGRRGKDGKVVVLRGRPMGYIELYVESSIDEIDFSRTKDFTIKICVELKSRIQSDINYISKTKVSIHGDRRVILNDKSSFWSSDYFRAEQNLKKCFPPLKVTFSSLLNPKPDEKPLGFNIVAETEEWDVFCYNCGITEPSKEFLEIPFIMDCLLDDGGIMRCQHDLKVSSSIKEVSQSSYTIGSSSVITLVAEISNTPNRDPAFQPMIEITYPKELSILRNINKCTNIKSEYKLECSLPGPIRPGSKKSLSVEFDASNLIGSPFDDERALLFPKISVWSRSTYSKDMDMSNNQDSLRIPLLTEADFNLLVEDEGKVTNSSLYFNAFKLRNMLSSPLEGIQTEFLIPFSDVGGNQFVFDESFSAQSSGSEKVLPCTEKMLLQREHLNVSGTAKGDNVVSCHSQGIRCLRVKCPDLKIIFPDEEAYISVRFSFDEDHIRSLTGQSKPHSPIYIHVEGRVENGYLDPNLDSYPDSATMNALLTPSRTSRTTQLFLIAGASAVGSICCIILIIFILYKLKVFERKNFEVMEQEDEPMMMEDCGEQK